MEDEGFEKFVEQEERVKKGTKVISFDLEGLCNYDTKVISIVK